MGAVSIYRALLLLRGCWLLVVWFFGWEAHSTRVNSFALLHPYAVLFADALAVASWLVILAGLWFFRRWARLIFVLLLLAGIIYSALGPHHHFRSAPPSFVFTVSSFVVMLNGAVVAMSFLPPVRDSFVRQV
jgi:hypothetical protein